MPDPGEFATTVAALPSPDLSATISPLALQASAELATAADQEATMAAALVAAVRASSRKLPRIELGSEPLSEADLQLVGSIGQGGMGRVDTAIQHVFGRTVAVKRVRPDRLCPASVEALVREATVTGYLDHPNIVPAHLFGRTASGEPALVMKCVVGVPWAELLADPQHPGWQAQRADRLGRNLEILMDVCQAAEAAHRRGIVHCDLKPANVMVGDLGEVYVLDWGVAVRLQEPRSSHLAGTPAYMAPEMLRGSRQVSAATDVYLLGAVLYEVITGRPPHQAPTLAEALAAVAANQIEAFPAHVPAELAAICRRALATEPEQRWPSALALRDALVEHLGHRGSMELVAAGRASLAALSAAVRADSTEPNKRNSARGLAAEAEFSFRQALRSWPANPVAAEGRAELCVLRVELELAEGNAAGAEAALAELGEPPAVLVQRVQALLAQQAEQAQAQAELARLRHERNFGAAALTPIISMALGCLGIAAAGLALELAEVQVSARGIMLFWLVTSVTAVAMVLGQRRKVVVNEANRTTQLSYVVNLGFTLVSTVLAWALDVSASAATIISMAVMGQGVAQTAVWGERSIATYLWAVPATIAAALLWPDRPFRAYVAFGLVALLGAGQRWRERRQLVSKPRP